MKSFEENEGLSYLQGELEPDKFRVAVNAAGVLDDELGLQVAEVIW